MANLNIPKRFREGVYKLSRIDNLTVRSIRGALGTLLPSGSQPSKAAVAAVSAISDTNKGDFAQIAEALAALASVKAGADVSLSVFVDDVAEAMEEIDEAEWRLPETQIDRFKETLTTLLSADEFALVAKIHDLQTEDERTFCRARILTDLRPVFGPKIEAGPEGMVIVHLLKLGFHQSSERKHDEFYVSLDADDLQTLKGVIERAEAKSKSLRASIKEIKIFGDKE